MNLLASLLAFPLLFNSIQNSSSFNKSNFGADFSSGEYAYQLMDKFFESPNTISALIRLDKNVTNNSSYGVIFGNYCKYNEGSVNLEINEEKHVFFRWNSDEIQVIFDEYEVPYNEYVYLSVVRDKKEESFSLYVDGLLKQKILTSTGSEAVSSYKYIIGSDVSNWSDRKNPFHGEIKQVSVYSSSLNSREVFLDYHSLDEISYKTRDNLLFNSKLSLNDKYLFDTSRYKNDAHLISIDKFYKDELFKAKDYSFAVIPDPQLVTNHRRDKIDCLGDYLLKMYETQKLSLAMCVGDNADCSGHWDEELGAITSQFDRLEGKVKYTTVPGNHDYTNNCKESRDLSWYNKYFSPERVKNYSYFGGLYNESETQNSYYLFTESGVDYLIMCLEFGPDDSVIEWANEIVSLYPNRRVIVTTHGYIDADGEFLSSKKLHCPSAYPWNDVVETNNGDEMYDKFVKKHENIFMVLCGHIPTDDIILREDVGEKGNVIPTFLIDGQGLLQNWGCELLVSLFNFDELNQEININYVSTITEELYNIQNQFTYSFKGNTKILSSLYYDENGELKDEFNKHTKSEINLSNNNINLQFGAFFAILTFILLLRRNLRKVVK